MLVTGLLAAALAVAAPPGDWHAQLAELKGLARIAAGGGAWKAAAAGTRLDPGDVITTLPDARARLEFPDGSRVTLGPVATLRVSAPEARSRGVSLLRGFARFVAAKRSDWELTVSTPTAVAAVKGTRFAVAVDGDLTEIRVAEGEVLCQDRARRYAVLMRAGEAAQWDDRGLWKPVRRMSAEEAAAAGDEDAPPPAAGAALPGGLRLGGYVTLNWTQLDGATGKSDPRYALSPLNPLQAVRGHAHGGFSNPWLAISAASRLGERARTAWELWLTQGGANPWPTVNNYHGRLEILNAYAEADLVRAPRSGPVPLALRAGIFQAPLGQINQSFALPLRTFTQVPLYASRMIPVPYQDIGAELGGGFSTPWGTLRYQAAALNGMQVEPADGWQRPLIEADGLWWARPAEDERFLGQDNNPSRAAAGRIGWSVPGLTFGVSAYQGLMDKDSMYELEVVTGDLALSLELPLARVVLRAEGGETDMDAPPGIFSGWPENGGFVELEAAPLAWPVSAGVGYSLVRRAARAESPDSVGEVYAAVAWRFVPELVFKLEARRSTVESVSPPLDALIVQVAAFW